MRSRDPVWHSYGMETPRGAWDAAAKALDLVRRALVFRTLLLVLGIAYIASLLVRAPGAETRHLLDCWLGAADTLVTLVALIGVSRYVTRAPDGHAGSAGFAPLCLGTALFAQIYRDWIDIQIVRSASAPIAGLGDHVAHLPYLEIVASGGALLALWSLLGGLVSVARELSSETVARRARAMAVMTGVLSTAFGGFEYWVTTGRPDDSALMIWLVLAVFALGVLCLAAGTLAMASDAMRTGPRQTLPGARVVSEA